MAFEELKSAIMSGSDEAVVAVLAPWSESERKAALPFLYQLIGQLHQPPGIDQNRARNKAAELAIFGLAGRKDIDVEHVERAGEAGAQILLDRSPAWLGKLVERYCHNFEITTWYAFFAAGLIEWDDNNDRLVNYMMTWIPAMREDYPRKLELVFEQVPQLREYHYRAPHFDFLRFWATFIEQESATGELDRLRFLRAGLTGLDLGFKRDHQKEIIALIECVNPTDDEWVEVFPELLSLLQHSSVTVLGFVVDRIMAMFENKTIDLATVLPALVALFQVKQKKYAAAALKMASLAAAISEHRQASVALAAHGLQHTAADLQKKALKILADHLNRDDVEIIEQLKVDSDAVAATLKPKLNELLNSLGASPEVIAKADTGTAVKQTGFDLAAIEQRIAGLSEFVRKELHVDEALSAVRNDRIDASCVWSVMSRQVLVDSQRIQPIQSLDELIDAVMVAVERLDTPDEWNRILDGLLRFADERPDDFELKTAALKKRLDRDFDGSSLSRGLLGISHLYQVAPILEAWVGIRSYNFADFSPRSDLMSDFYALARRCLQLRLPRQLLSTPTHAGGWIDPVVWVSRLQDMTESDDEINNADFALSALRLAPDNRQACLEQLNGLNQPWHDLAASLLGRDVELAGRTTFPWPESRIAFDWYPFAVASEFPFAIREPAPSDMSLTLLIKYSGMYRMQVNLRNPTWFYPWLSTLWPSNLLWYWQRACESFVERMEYRTKSDEAHDKYLQPLFEPYRSLTALSAQALWLATFSQGSSRFAAVDVWIELVSTGRADIELLLTTLQEVTTSIKIPAKRLITAMTEVAAVGPLHTWTAAEIVQRYLAGLETLPRETGAFLALLLEWLTQLGLTVSEPFSVTLSDIRSGKAKQLAKQLLALQKSESGQRNEALSLFLEARLSRAEASCIDVRPQ